MCVPVACVCLSHVRPLCGLLPATRCLDGLLFRVSDFLRLSFGDESGDKLFNNRSEPVDAFYGRMRTVLQAGGWTAAAWPVTAPGAAVRSVLCMQRYC